MVDDSGTVVPDRGRVAVGIRRPEGGFPDREVLPAAPVTSPSVVQLILLSELHDRLAIGPALGWPVLCDPLVAMDLEGIGVAVDVHLLVPPKVDRIGIERPCPAEEFGMVDLQRNGLPPASRATGEQA